MNMDYYLTRNLNNEEISFEEALQLFELSLPQLGMIADEIRKERCGDVVTFVGDRIINYTNKCTSKCKFCAFYARNNDEAYVLSKEDILEKIEDAVRLSTTQIMIQGGLNPQLRIEWFEDLFTSIKEKFEGVQVHSLSAPEIHYLAKIEKTSVKEVLKRLNDAGLDSLPGGGAEILTDRVRSDLSPHKVNADGWLEVMKTAHKLGMKTTATMMFGHIEEDEDIVEHLFKIKDLQAETGGFTAFIPWTFEAERTELFHRVKKVASPTRFLQVLAISRIVLHNIKNFQTSWLTQNVDIAKLSLFFGANDFSGTMVEENVVRATGKEILPATMEGIISAAKDVGRQVAQRNTNYEVLRYF
ncbi:MAG: cyclic dehypoxanthinyl futalosine synthase [Archaeoglobaceae archaeon]